MNKTLFYRLIIFLLLSISINGYTQVTIGLGETPMSGALLQLKEKEDITDGALNAYKGLALPRVALSAKKELYPMFLKNPEIATSGPSDNYDSESKKEALDKLHTGLIVYNLVEDEDKELCLGLNQWDGEQWECFQQKPTTAKSEFDCGSIQVLGDYGDGIALNTSNYLRINLNVTRIGSYSITATSATDNGYFFELSGTFYSTGTFTLTIPGTGQPKEHTQGTNLLDPADDTPDQFTLKVTGGETDCNFAINVRSTAAKPEFEMDCGATAVEGMYFEDQELSSIPNQINNQSHRIKVTLKNIPASAFGAIARFETNTVDGISFKGESVLTSTTQEVYLAGTGVPRTLEDKKMTITSNSQLSTASCQATIRMLIPRKRLMTLGNTDAVYGYNLGLPTARRGAETGAIPGYNSGNDLITNKDNFGYNQWSIVPFAGFTNKGTGATANTPSAMNNWVDDDRDIISLSAALWQGMSASTLESYLKGTNGHNKIDIFMIGHDVIEYYRNGNTADRDRCQVLINFVKEGGILMICSERTDSNGNFMNLFFGVTNIGSAEGAGPGKLYTLGFNSDNMPADYKSYYCKDDDPILAGPFEDIVGRTWGEDASNTRYLTNLPLDEIVIYSGAREMGNTSRPADGVTIFRHKEYPLVFIGDGGFNSNEHRKYEGRTVCPFRLTTKTIKGKTYNNYPTYRPGYDTAAGRAYNAVFTANAFAWCVYKAEELRRDNN